MENVNTKNRNLLKFERLFLGASAGTSKKGNEYCMVQFLEINRFKKGEILTLSTADNTLPAICDSLVCGDKVELVVEVVSMAQPPILVEITKKVADSVLI